jgi:Zn-dependent protease with chaperone function
MQDDSIHPSASRFAMTDFHAPSSCSCTCFLHSRRLFTGGLLAGAGALLATPAVSWAREGVDVGPPSNFSKLVSADDIEKAAVQRYGQLKQGAGQQGALAPDSHPQVIRLRSIAKRLIPFSYEWNARARQWNWEINVIESKQLNAFCMPAGKIAFYTGILEQLQLSDDEVSMIMGHEITHALREHAREQMGKSVATQGAIEITSSLFGVKGGGRMVADMGQQLLALRFGREDETEADLVGMELSARAGYDPAAGISLWEKMGAASKGAPPQFLSTHPSGPTRIKDIRTSLPKVAGLYARAPKPERQFGPPAREG